MFAIPCLLHGQHGSNDAFAGQKKELSPETPLKDIVGFPVVNPAFKDTPLTIRQVMSHTSSFLSISQYRPNWEHLLHENKYFDEYHGPGTRYEYSNMNGGLMDAMIEALSGQSRTPICRKMCSARWASRRPIMRRSCRISPALPPPEPGRQRLSQHKKKN